MRISFQFQQVIRQIYVIRDRSISCKYIKFSACSLRKVHSVTENCVQISVRCYGQGETVRFSLLRYILEKEYN